MRTLAVIGTGRLAIGLGRLWTEANTLTIAAVRGRSAHSAARAVAAMGAGYPASDARQLAPADLVLIATPDDALATVSAELAASGCIHAQSIVFHCSGAESSAVLAPLRATGAALASAHPLTSFSGTPPSAAAFKGVACAIEGDPRAVAVLREIFTAIGGRPVELPTEHKILYHAAAVFGSNYLVALLAAATRTHALIGIDGPLSTELLAPLVHQTVENVLRAGPKAALTGPIARGDFALVRRQYERLGESDPALAALYRALAASTAALAGRADPLAGQGTAQPGHAPGGALPSAGSTASSSPSPSPSPSPEA